MSAAKKTAKKKTTPSKTKTPLKKKTVASRTGPRRLKQSQYRSFRLQRRIKPLQPTLPSAFTLFRRSIKLLKDQRRLFLGIAIIYAILTLVLVLGFKRSVDLGSLKQVLQTSSNGHAKALATAGSLFSALLGSTGSSSTATGSAYQGILLVVVSLATIWGLRQVLAGEQVRTRDTFYKGLYPLVPFILVLLVVGLQLLPVAFGSLIYSAAVSSTVLVSFAEKALFVIFFILTALLSMYMICSSLFALFVVTLPDMTPMKALRSARKLVLHRRFVVIRKVLFLPLILLVIAGVIMLPFLLFLAVIADWVFFALTMVGWVVAITYMYNLYRELLNE